MCCTRVLGLLARAEHVAAEGEQRRRVALEGDLEGGLAAALDLLHEPVVAGQAQQAPRAHGAPASACGDAIGTTHMNAVGRVEVRP